MKILMLLSNAFNPDPRVHQEAKALVDDGYEVTILCWDRDLRAHRHEIIDGIHVERIYVKSTHGRGSTQLIFLLFFWLKVYFSVIKKSFQVVHCHDFDTLPLGFFLARQRNTKLVYDAHESYIDMLINIPLWFKKIIYKSENYFLKRVDLLITVGEILKQAFEKRGAKNTCVVGNWKDPEKFRFPNKLLKEEKHKLGISDNQLIISFIANLTAERQLPQLIEATKNKSDIFLLIGGAGSCAEMAGNAARNCSNIHYLGFVNPEIIPLYTAISDLVFYGFDPENRNSKFSSPNKLFEALAAGVPILTGDFGEIGRIVKKHKCGIILENYSKSEMTRALDELKVGNRRIYGANALEAAKTLYNWEFAEKTLLDNYHQLLGQTSSFVR